MKIKHLVSRWNTLTTKKHTYHDKLSASEIQKALKNIRPNGNGVFYRNEHTIVLVTPDKFVEVKSTVDNSFTNNKYIDLYSYEL
jgi:hypothetical protein